MKKGIEALVLLMVVALAGACAEAGEDATITEEPADTTAVAETEADLSAIRADLEAANDAFSDAMGAGDVAGAARQIYTEDAVIYPPGGEAVEGREAIVEFWTGGVEQMGVTGVDLTTVEVETAGPGMAWEVGEFDIQGAEGSLDRGSYVVIWKNTADGWKWHRDIWNSDGAAEAEAPAGDETAETG